MPQSFGILVGTELGLHGIGIPVPAGLESRSVSALAVDGDSLWAISGGDTVWRSESSGPWQLVDLPDGQQITCLLPVPNGLLVGAGEGRLLRLSAGRLTPDRGFDRVDCRERWYTPWGGPPETRSMAADAGGDIYVNVHVGGVVRSADGVDGWRPTGMDIHSDVHQVVVHPAEPGHLFAACAYGLAWSRDRGGTWKMDRDGMQAAYCRAVAVAGEHVIVSASRGPGGGRACLYRRPVGNSGAFVKCSKGLPAWLAGNIDTHCLAADGEYAAFGTEDGAVFASTNQGRSWQQVGHGLPPVLCLALVAQ